MAQASRIGIFTSVYVVRKHSANTWTRLSGIAHYNVTLQTFFFLRSSANFTLETPLWRRSDPPFNLLWRQGERQNNWSTNDRDLLSRPLCNTKSSSLSDFIWAEMFKFIQEMSFLFHFGPTYPSDWYLLHFFVMAPFRCLDSCHNNAINTRLVHLT